MSPARERSQVRWGTTTIPYLVHRSGRRATVAVAVEPTGDVVLTAPLSTPLLRLDQVVLSKAPWIVERVRRKSEPALQAAREFVSGETFRYLGRQYRLRVELCAEGVGEAGLRRGLLVVPIRASLSEEAAVGQVREALIGWYKEHAAERLPERARLWADRLGIDAPRVLIREPKKRWGSCDAKGTLRLNWRVIQAPLRLVDYVVAHELCHLDHPDHTRAFWATIGRVMPDYDARRDALRELGGALAW